jgi:predicted glycosyltransferase
MPRGVDYVKLPSVDRVSAEKYEPLSLLHCGNEVRLARSGMVTNIVTSFRPDLLVVDKRAAGINGELVESLRYLKKESPKTKIVLGIRDILDAPKHTSRVLRENGSFNIIEEFYHEVWIYGSSEIFDSAQEYDFPANVRLKTRYCGYLQRPTSERRISSKDIRVLVTTGGGGDGSRMIETYLACLPRLRAKLSVSSTIVFGPQIDTARRDELYARYSDLQYVKFLDFEPDLTQRYSDADVVVSMAGYNTVCELLSHKKKAVLVPRSEPVQEQLIRARLLADHGLFQMIEPADLSPQTMMDKIITAAKTPSQSMRRLDLDGLTRIRGRVRDLLKDQRA